MHANVQAKIADLLCNLREKICVLLLRQITGAGPTQMNDRFIADWKYFLRIIFKVFLGSAFSFDQLPIIDGISVPMI